MNKINIILMYLVLTFVVIVPMNMGSVFADNVDTATTTKGSISSQCQVFKPTNPKDSLVMSILTLCLPGIVEKLYQLEDIKCAKIKCRYESARDGLDENKCNVIQQYSECKYIYGEVFNVVGLNLFEGLRSRVKQALLNPVGLFYGAAVSYARSIVSSCGVAGVVDKAKKASNVANAARAVNGDISGFIPTPQLTCDNPWVLGSAIALSINDVIALYGRFSEMDKNDLSLKKDNVCDEIPDIKEKLEEIVNEEEKEEKKVEAERQEEERNSRSNGGTAGARE